MAKKYDLTVAQNDVSIAGILDQGCEFEGKLSFRGTVQINGMFRGEIYTPDTLIIGEDAHVQADVRVGIAIINGEFVGKVSAKHRVEIRNPAVFKGDIETPSLSVDEGVLFEGSSRMVETKLT